MPFRVIPVIDLLGGSVVRGVAGERAAYRPVQSSLVAGSQPVAIAQALQATFGFQDVYVADLDAIQHGAVAATAWHDIARSGMNLLLDAGVTHAATACQVDALCNELPRKVQIVVALETLTSLAALSEIVTAIGTERVLFSLDLFQGEPRSVAPEFEQLSAQEIVAQVQAVGISRMIVLDVAQVGVAQGVTTLELCRALLAAHPHLRLITGGGVRSVDDLRAIEHAGCEGALVASTLHDGTFTPQALAPWSPN